MSNLVSIQPSPLMSPVQYNGQTYFTGQYFHQMYRANSDADGKYKQTSHFLRLIRSIESYPLYVESGDIVEMTWGQAKSAGPEPGPSGSTSNAEFALLLKSNSYKHKVGTELGLASDFSDPVFGSLKSLFQASRYQPIMLINATAQVALTHHLDDEVSKLTSVAINQQAATASHTTEIGQVKTAKAVLDFFLYAGKKLGTDEAMARAVAVDAVRQKTGIDASLLLACNTVAEAPMTSTELGKLHGLAGKVGEKMNAILFERGFAVKVGNDWMPTDKGKPYCTCNPYKSPHSEHTGYRTLWYRRILDVLTKDDVASSYIQR